MSDWGDGIRFWVKSKRPLSAGAGSLHGFGDQAAGAAPAHLPEQHPSLNDFFLRVAGELQTGCQIVISSWRGDHY